MSDHARTKNQQSELGEAAEASARPPQQEQEKDVYAPANDRRAGSDRISASTAGKAARIEDIPCPDCGISAWWGVQYQGTSQDWDGVSEWNCGGCGARFGRWTRQRLVGEDIERRYGGGR